MFVFLALMLKPMRLCLCLCESENSRRQISGFVLLTFLLMLTLMSRVFSLVKLGLHCDISISRSINISIKKLTHVT